VCDGATASGQWNSVGHRRMLLPLGVAVMVTGATGWCSYLLSRPAPEYSLSGLHPELNVPTTTN